ncbi:MAG: flippase [Chloroflexota bacterium]|nr:flippase [Chloroflexota bacterium]
MRDFFENLVKGSLIYGLGSVVSLLVGFFLLPVYTRYLTPADYGVLETLVVTTTIISIFLIFGMDNSLFRFSFDSKEEVHRKRVMATTCTFLFGLVFLVTPILILWSGFLSNLLFHDHDHIVLLNIVFLTAGVLTVHKIPMSLFRINNEPIKYAIVSGLQVLVTASLCILFVVVLETGVLGVVTGTLIGVSSATLFAFWLVRDCLVFSFSFNLLRSMIRYSLPMIPAGLALWILSASDRYFLLAYSTETELGLYSIASKFAMVIALIIMAFRMAWPQSAFSVIEREDNKELYARTLTYFVFTGCLIVLMLALFGDNLLAFLTTEDFFGAAKAIPILGLGLVFSGCYTLLAIGMGVTKKVGMIIPVTAIPAALNLFLNYLLIPPYGMMGAAWATLISFALMAFLSWWASERVYHINYEWIRIGKVLSVMLVILAITYFITFEHLYHAIPVKLGLISSYIVVLLLIKFFTMEEYDGVKRLLSDLYGKIRGRKSILNRFATHSNG